MQHRYFGDVGDFGKYGLLRILSGLEDEQKLKLGVIWYLFPDESHNADGKHVGYLHKPRDYRDCDEQLFDKLRAFLFDDLGRLIETNRYVSNAAGLLPEGTVFYDEPLSYPKELPFPARVSLRKEWFADALIKTASADLVFVDPDNGIECKIKRTTQKGPKYVFWDDIDSFVEREQSVVVYHHLGRTGSHTEQIQEKLRQMHERFGKDSEVVAVRSKRGSSRAYFIIASPRHKDLLRQHLAKMRSGPWNRHFDFE